MTKMTDKLTKEDYDTYYQQLSDIINIEYGERILNDLFPDQKKRGKSYFVRFQDTSRTTQESIFCTDKGVWGLKWFGGAYANGKEFITVLEVYQIHSSLDRKKAIKELCQNYGIYDFEELGIKPIEPIKAKPIEQKKIDSEAEKRKVQYIISQLKSDNSLAKQHLIIGRGLADIPSNFYYLNEFAGETAIAFVDSEKSMINLRAFNPITFESCLFESVASKTKNISSFTNCVYDCTYRPEEARVYVVEGIFNAFALWLNGCSVLATFSSSNHLSNAEKFRTYFKDKIVVLAFDNDISQQQAGQKYTQKIARFIAGNCEPLSIEVLKFPPQTDPNDLHQRDELSDFLGDSQHYTQWVATAEPTIEAPSKFSPTAKVANNTPPEPSEPEDLDYYDEDRKTQIKKIWAELNSLSNEIADQLSPYKRVGTKYYKIIANYDVVYQFSYPSFEAWDLKTIQDDHGKCTIKYRDKMRELYEVKYGSQIKPPALNWSNFIEKFDKFCYYPDNLNYQARINDQYNVYQPITHSVEKRDCPTILNFIRHIFGEAYDLGLDYLTLLFRQPTQALPILCLVSEANNTGKTTFLNLLKIIFQGNASIIGTQELDSPFNTSYVGKLVVMVDETFINFKKQTLVQKIKKMVTDKKTWVNRKFQGETEINSFTKLILTSNHPENFVSIEMQETRFWIIQPPEYSAYIADLEQRFTAEIAGFLHLLSTRAISTLRKSRFWFDIPLIQNETLSQLKQYSRPTYETEIIHFIEDCFDNFETDTLQFTAKDIHEELLPNLRTLEKKEVTKFLNHLGFEASNKAERYTFYSLRNLRYNENEADLRKHKPSEIRNKVGKPITITRDIWLELSP